MDSKRLPRTARTKLKMLASEGRTDEYIACCGQNLRWACAKIGPQSMSACIALIDLSDGYKYINDLTTAIKLYTEALEIVRKKHGEKNDLYASVLDSLLETQRRIDRDAEHSS